MILGTMKLTLFMLGLYSTTGRRSIPPAVPLTPRRAIIAEVSRTDCD